jgi:hypothetical protein
MWEHCELHWHDEETAAVSTFLNAHSHVSGACVSSAALHTSTDDAASSARSTAQHRNRNPMDGLHITAQHNSSCLHVLSAGSARLLLVCGCHSKDCNSARV